MIGDKTEHFEISVISANCLYNADLHPRSVTGVFWLHAMLGDGTILSATPVIAPRDGRQAPRRPPLPGSQVTQALLRLRHDEAALPFRLRHGNLHLQEALARCHDPGVGRVHAPAP